MSATDIADPQSSPAPTSANRINRGHACSSCSRRKIRCDGQRPCAACLKTRIECGGKPAATPQRRRPKKSLSQQDVLSRLRWEEDQSQAGGIDAHEATLERSKGRPAGIETTYNNSGSSEPRADTERVILEQGHPRYVDKYAPSRLLPSRGNSS